MSDHTPGPWRWRNINESNQALNFRLMGLIGGNDQRICEFAILDTFGLHDADAAPNAAPNDADAALIAAAPGLLKACKAAQMWIRGEGELIPYEVLVQLRDAIAKATDQTPEEAGR